MLFIFNGLTKAENGEFMKDTYRTHCQEVMRHLVSVFHGLS